MQDSQADQDLYAPHILIVEDTRSVGMMLKAFFGRRQIGATLVPTLAAAREQLQSGRSFSLILLDNHLPDGQGHELLSEIYSLWPGIPVVMLTASDDQQLMLDYFQAGVVDYVLKPVHLELLLVKARRWMDFYHHQLRINQRPQQPRVPRLLILEDDFDAAMLVQFELTEYHCDDYLIHLCESLADVRQLLMGEGYVPDILLSDLNLPDSSGMQTVKQLRHWFPDLPLVVLTGQDDPQAGMEAINAGADDYLVKGVEIEQLHRTLQFALRRGWYRAGQRFAHAVFAHAQEGICVLDQQGRILEANPELLKVTGLSLTQLQNQSLQVCLAGDEGEVLFGEIWRSVLITGQWAGEVQLQQRVAGLCIQNLTISAIRNELGQAINYLAFFNDVTERVRQQQLLAEKNASLNRLLNERAAEEEMAQCVYMHMATAWQKALPFVEVSISPAGTFSGDLVLWELSPDGNFYLACLDATGHGLAAAITLMPMAEVFSVLVSKNAPLEQLVREMNKKLDKLLPDDRFVSASLMRVDVGTQRFRFWSGGAPPVFLLNEQAQINAILRSRNMPLGILPDDVFEPAFDEGCLKDHHSCVLVSDGVLEQTDAAGRAFSLSGLEAALRDSNGRHVVSGVMQALKHHAGNLTTHDDATVCQLRLQELLRPTVQTSEGSVF